MICLASSSMIGIIAHEEEGEANETFYVAGPEIFVPERPVRRRKPRVEHQFVQLVRAQIGSTVAIELNQ